MRGRWAMLGSGGESTRTMGETGVGLDPKIGARGSMLVPSAHAPDARRTRRYRRLTDAAAAGS